jgi:hypothetical protein
LFKVDFDKTYDKVFLFQVLLMTCFPVQFIDWVKNVVNNGSVAVMVNDHLGSYSKTLRRVQQGDAWSPILFD